MRCFAITAIGTFAILSATAFCAAQAAMNTGVASAFSVRIQLASERAPRAEKPGNSRQMHPSRQ